MKNFQIMRYLKKILPIIVIFCVLATYAINLKLKQSNTYVASEVIHYNDPAAEQGVTPTGSKLDVNEIKSSAVMSKVVDRMGLTGIYSVDSLISRLSITPIPDADKVAQKEAKLEEGEEYIYLTRSGKRINKVASEETAFWVMPGEMVVVFNSNKSVSDRGLIFSGKSESLKPHDL